MVFQLLRVIAVVALVVASAAVATPKGRVPLALRGVMRILRRDGRNVSCAEEKPVSSVRKLAAFLLVVAAAVLAMAGR